MTDRPDAKTGGNRSEEAMKHLRLYTDAAIVEPEKPLFFRDEGIIISKEELSNPQLEYKMNGNRGICLIINQENFNYQRTGQKQRVGTNIDAANCVKTFEKLGYIVKRYDDLSSQDIIDKIREYSSMDHTDHDSFVLILLSHGEGEYIYGTDGKIKIGDMLNNFKGRRCRSLLGKPKLCFIQACRGVLFDYGEYLQYIDHIPETSIIKKIPVEADFMIAHATCPGYTAWRREDKGSWFIRSLCKVLSEHSGQYDLNTMMTLVHRFVAYGYDSHTTMEETSGMKQMPAYVSMLTKLLYFRPTQ